MKPDSPANLEAAYAQARAVKADHTSALMAKANVVGVGVGLRSTPGEPQQQVALVVMVTHKLPASQLAPDDLLPKEIEGVPVEVQVVGELRPQT